MPCDLQPLALYFIIEPTGAADPKQNNPDLANSAQIIEVNLKVNPQ